MALPSDFPVKYIISTGEKNARAPLKILYFTNKEEVIGMWSEALWILDENSLKYYVEELKEELRNQKMSAEFDKALNDALREKDAEITVLKAQLESKIDTTEFK